MSIAEQPTTGSLVPRRPGILPVAALFLGLIAGLLPARSGAAEPEAAPEPKPELAVTAISPEQLAALNGRWQKLLGELQPYNIPQLEEISAAPAATTLRELIARVDQVYTETAFQAAHRYWTYETNLRALTDERVRLEAARVDQSKLEQELATAPVRLKTEEARSAALTARAANEERMVTTLRENSAALEEDFLAARESALGSVYYLLPTNQRVAFHNGTQKNSNHPAYARLPEVESDRAARAAPPAAKPGAAKKENTGPTPPPPVAGSIDEKLAAFEDKQRALRSVAALLPPQEKQLATARELADAQQSLNETLLARLAEFEAPLAKCAAAASEAEDRILTAQVNQKICAGNLLRLGTSAILWSYLKERVVAPQMESFLEDNRLAKGRKGTALIDAINQRPQDFIPRSGTFDHPQPLNSLRLKLLDIEPSLDVWAGVATDALAAGKVGAGAELTARFFRNLGKPEVEILRTSLDTLEPAQKMMALALLARAPAE